VRQQRAEPGQAPVCLGGQPARQRREDREGFAGDLAAPERCSQLSAPDEPRPATGRHDRRLPDQDQASRADDAAGLVQDSRHRAAVAGRREHQQQERRGERAVRPVEPARVGELDRGSRDARAGRRDAWPIEIHAMEPRARDSRVREALQPPAGAAADVHERLLAGQRGLCQPAQRRGGLGADRLVAGVVGRPGAQLAT
jgi:hypothetical protein